MKTFEIFLRNGTVARVIAAKMERKVTGDGLVASPQLVCLSDSGEIVAQFVAGDVSGVMSAPISGNASP